MSQKQPASPPPKVMAPTTPRKLQQSLTVPVLKSDALFEYSVCMNVRRPDGVDSRTHPPAALAAGQGGGGPLEGHVWPLPRAQGALSGALRTHARCPWGRGASPAPQGPAWRGQRGRKPFALHVAFIMRFFTSERQFICSEFPETNSHEEKKKFWKLCPSLMIRSGNS